MAEREVVEPSPGTLYSLAHAAAHQFWSGQGFVTPSGERLFSDQGPHNPTNEQSAFGYNASRWDDTTARIDTGEAFVAGKAVYKDTVTDVDLADNTAGQTVYVGWAAASSDAIIDLESGFPTDHQKLPLHEFETAGGEVIGHDDLRVIGPRIETDDEGRVIVGGQLTAADDYLRTEIDHAGRTLLGTGEPDGDVGIYTGSTTDGSIGIIAPQIGMVGAFGNQLRFYYDPDHPADGYWAFRRGFHSEDDVDLEGNDLDRVGTIGGNNDGADPPTLSDGVDLTDRIDSLVDDVLARWRTTNSNNAMRPEWSSDGQRFVLTPVVDGDAQTQQQLRYNFETGRWEFRGGHSAQGSALEDVNSEGESAVSSADVTKIIVSDTEPSESEPHLWLEPE